MTRHEGFTLFQSFLNFLCPFQLLSKRLGWRFLARGRASLNLKWISDEISYCETKNDFSTKSWALDHVSVVQICPTSYWFSINLFFFTKSGRKRLRYPGWQIVHVMWSSIFEKMGWYHFETSIWWLLHKTPRFRHSENKNWFFGAMKWKTSSCNIVRHPKMHMCA